MVVIPLAGSVPGGSTDGLDRALTRAGERAGVRIELAQVSREDVLILAGCQDESASCLRRVRDTLDVEAVVIGSVEPTADGARVTVALIERDRAPTHVTFDLVGDQASMEAELEERAQALLGGAAGGETAEADGASGEDPDADAAGSDPADARDAGGRFNRFPYRFEAGRVETWSYGLAAAGGALFITGLVLHGAAGSRQDRVDQAPTDTLEDLERLRRLERSGKRLNRLGNAFTLVGLAAAVTGTVFIASQGMVRVEEPEVVASPLVIPGGAGVSLRWRLP